MPDAASPGRRGAIPTASPTAVVVETAERREVPIIAELPARTQAAVTVEIRANVEGQLTEMSFKEGNLVRKGQPLFQIDSRRYDAEVQSAEAAVEKAEADLEMAREQQHFMNAESALRQAEAALLKANQDVGTNETSGCPPGGAAARYGCRHCSAVFGRRGGGGRARHDANDHGRRPHGPKAGAGQPDGGPGGARQSPLDREETAIHAPISGLIGTVEVSVGNYVGRGESNRLATISQVDPINVVFGISEALYLRTVDKVDRKALERIDLILPDNSQYAFRGRYTNIGRALDEKTGTLQIEAQFPNPKGLLVPGMSGRVRVALEEPAGAVLVPEQAVFDAQGSEAVYIVSADNKVVLRSVATGGSYQSKSIINKGARRWGKRDRRRHRKGAARTISDLPDSPGCPREVSPGMARDYLHRPVLATFLSPLAPILLLSGCAAPLPAAGHSRSAELSRRSRQSGRRRRPEWPNLASRLKLAVSVNSAGRT